MAPNSSQGASYFPPLDKCLNTPGTLVSWSAAYHALFDSAPPFADDDSSNTSLQAFLSDPETQHYLVNGIDPYLTNASKTKSDFETKTAPIHAPQSANGDYDVEVIRKDALWLSEQLGVEELVALRTAVLEWQGRAEGTLLAQLAAGDGEVLESPSEETRRQRLLQIYLEEKSYILKTSTHLVNLATAERWSGDAATRSWVLDLADKVVDGQGSPANSTAYEANLLHCIEVVSRSLDNINNSDSRIPPLFLQGAVNELLYATTTFTDITTGFRLILATLHLNNIVLSSTVVLSWFRLVEKLNFFQEPPTTAILPDPTSLQSLASLISVSILRLPEALTHLRAKFSPNEQSQIQYPNLPRQDETGSKLWHAHSSTLHDLNLILYNAASRNVTLAAPAILAWSLFVSALQAIVRRIEDGRDPSSGDRDASGRRRPSSRGTGDTESEPERLLASLQDHQIHLEARDDLGLYFAETSVDQLGLCSVLTVIATSLDAIYAGGDTAVVEGEAATALFARSTVIELLRDGLSRLIYSEEVIDVLLAALSPSASLTPGETVRLTRRLAERSLADNEVFRPLILHEALSRYPFEVAPLVRILSALAEARSSTANGATELVALLEDMKGLTMVVPEDFRGYALVNEDEEMNHIVLTEDLPLFESKQAQSYLGANLFGHGKRAITMGSGEGNSSDSSSSSPLFLPAGTHGIVVKEVRPLVIRFAHEHSGLEYLGLLLSTLLPTSELLPFPPMPSTCLDLPTASDIVRMITSLLYSCLRQDQGAEEAAFLLNRLSTALPSGTDIVSVIAEIMETELLTHLQQNATTANGSTDLLVSSIHFLVAVLRVHPPRVWSALFRSSLFGLANGANGLAAVVSGSEVPSASFPFLSAVIDLYLALIADALAGLVKRRARIRKQTGRFDSPVANEDATPERSVRAVLAAAQGVLGDAWFSLGEWRFGNKTEKTKIQTRLLESFETLLSRGVGNGGEKGQDGLCGVFVPAARIVADAFISGGLGGFSDVLAAACDAADGAEIFLSSALVEAATLFLTTLLRTTRVSHEGNVKAKQLGTQCVRMMPIFAALFATDLATKGAISTLLAEVVRVIDLPDANGQSDPPSLLGQLSATAGKRFLTLVSRLDRPFKEFEVESQMWTFLSAILQSRQQWFALYLLTGALPRDRLKSAGKESPGNPKSLLTTALDTLADIAIIPPERATALLKFIASSQNAWIWATTTVRSHPSFLQKSLDWLKQLTPPQRAGNLAQEMLAAAEYQMAAHLCDIIAVNLHASREVGNDETVLKLLLPRLDFLREYAVDVNGYNRSLHSNLAANFNGKFATSYLTLADLERDSLMNPAPFGEGTRYDVRFANDVLGHEVAWQGTGRRGERGFKDEVEKASVNLGFVDSQEALLKAWRGVVVGLCGILGSASGDNREMLQKEIVGAVEKCLRANADADLSVPGMDRVLQIRGEMAFVGLEALVGVKAKIDGIKNILRVVWEVIRTSAVDFDVATAQEDLAYYRTLLQVLFLAIQPHVYMVREQRQPNGATSEEKAEYLDPTVAGSLVGIVNKVIAPGFRALCGNLHTSVEMALPSDFALLTAIFRGITSIRGIESIYSQIADSVASANLVRGALSLYSWSDRLAESTTAPLGEQLDPVYAETATLFLLALSSVPQVADEMALTGALPHLSSANLSNIFRRRGGVDPFDYPQRGFAIWSQALLPLCLNLLSAVGPQAAPDVAAFFNSFPAQLGRAEIALENRVPSPRHPHAGAVTLGIVREAHCLCLIAEIIRSALSNAAALGLDANTIPRLEFDDAKVREEVVGLVRQKTSLAARLVPVGEREEAWARVSGAGTESLLMGMVVREIETLGSWGADGEES